MLSSALRFTQTLELERALPDTEVLVQLNDVDLPDNAGMQQQTAMRFSGDASIGRVRASTLASISLAELRLSTGLGPAAKWAGIVMRDSSERETCLLRDAPARFAASQEACEAAHRASA